MDIILDVLIPAVDFYKLKLLENIVEWGGERFSKDPPEYIFYSSVFFRKGICSNYYQNIIGDELNTSDYVVLTLEGESLSELEHSINSGYVDKNRSELVSFINELYSTINRFFIIMLLNEEQIDDKYQITNADDAVNVILNSLDWNCPRGLVISAKMS